MKITKIEQQKKNKSRYNLYIDNEFYTGIHEDVIVFLSLKAKMDVDQEFLNEILNKELIAKAKENAMRFIQYRMRSQKEVVKKLHDNEYPSHVIDEVVAFLKTYKFIDDAAYARAFVHDKLTISKHSRKRITYDLKAKGLPDALIDSAFNQLEEDVVDLQIESIFAQLPKKFRQYASKAKYSDYEVEQKVLQYFYQKGYRLHEIKVAIQRYKEEEIWKNS